MSYKTRIDAARKRQDAHRDNIHQTACEIAALKAKMFHFTNTPNISALLDEYNAYVQLYNAEERLIPEIQPWYRKVFGREY